jgi:ribonuclease P protein component
MAARAGRGRDLTSSRDLLAPQRLKSNKAFGAVHRRGRWLRGLQASLGVLGNHSPGTRIGIRTKRGIKRAVDRNRVKRQVRAVIFGARLRFKSGVDLVVVAHPRTLPAASADLQSELLKLFQRAGVLQP